MFNRLTRRGLCLASLISSTAAAQPRIWPARQVRVVVPWAPAGAIDIVARILAGKLSESLGQPFPVENRTGGGGVIGYGEVARAAPDGYTLLALDNSYTMLPHTTSSLPWDHASAFSPILLAGAAPFLFVVNSSSRFQTLAELIAAAREAPERVSFGTGGPGSSPHFVTEAFQQAVGIKMLHVPFRGGAEGMMAVVSRQVDCCMATLSASRGQLSAGLLRPLAIAADARSALAPDVPTFSELGLPGFTGGIWAGLAAPAGTPQAVLDRLETAGQAALRTEDLRRSFAVQGLDVSGLGQRGFAELIRSETARWGRVAEQSGMVRR